jgi:hypothetical protein
VGVRVVLSLWADSDVGAVGEDRDALAFADSDDPVRAGRGQVVRAPRAVRGTVEVPSVRRSPIPD